MMMPKPNEKIIISKDASMDTIMRANSERGRPKMTACFLIFL